MKQTCPNCAYEYEVETQQSRAAGALWASLSKEERSAEMKRRRALGIKRSKHKSKLSK